ncbi:aminotransferase-like domain-containing protein [Ideonella livida]|uniref:aminotransferase-like domain-containing protein n=1 Tax=Ideonella livida TaxID=2707176 RepID=UPI002873C6AB|nr:PLP-dependent aminotransferase family protein [Ideonella livida]
MSRPPCPTPVPEAAAGEEPAAPLYRQLAQRLGALVASGALRRGDRLPSVREMARQQGLAQTTVLQAYRTLEDERLIEARPRSGFFVAASAVRPRPGARRPSLAVPEQTQPPASPAPVDISTLVERTLEAARDPDFISFGAACPGGDLFPPERMRKAMGRALQRQQASMSRYPFAPGIRPLREVVARRALGYGCTLDPERIVITNGALESISLCLQAVTRPGDTVALESPTYFGLLQILESLHLKALEIPTHPRTGLSLPALELALQTQPVKALLAVPTLSNPLGAVMPLAQRKALARLLRTHRLPMIEDLIYNDLCPRAEARRAVRSFDPEGWVMLASSYSKTLAPGLRLGWVEGGRWAAQVQRLKAALSGGHTELLEWAMADLLEQVHHEPALRQLRSQVAQRMDLARRLVASSFPAGTRVTSPEGGFILWVELPGGLPALELHEAALRERICIAPGAMFSSSSRYDHCLRLGLGRGWGPAEQQALQRVGQLAQALLAARPRLAA